MLSLMLISGELEVNWFALIRLKFENRRNLDTVPNREAITQYF